MSKKISEEQIEKLIEKVTASIGKANTYFLTKMGVKLKKIKKPTPKKAQELIQMLRLNNDIDEVIKELSKYLDISIRDIDEVFDGYAKADHRFYKPFYEYRGVPFVEYAENKVLQTQTKAIANMIKNEVYRFTRNNILGYTIKDHLGNTQFLGLRDTYDKLLEEAFINVSQGEETFDVAMSKIMKDIGGSGLKTLDYKSGRSYRLDSAVRMHLQDGLRLLHNENQKIEGEKFDYDGIEVTHHLNAAPDHIDTVDGKQFAVVDKVREHMETGIPTEADRIRGNQVWVDGKVYDDFDAVNNSLARQVSTLNCRHRIFPIVLGVSKPEYTQEQLDADKQQNMQGFNFGGKHYTMYEGEQLQRSLERRIREQKDIQIFAKQSDNMELVNDSQQKITQLSNKYKELNNTSGLKPRADRLRVSGYKRTKVK